MKQTNSMKKLNIDELYSLLDEVIAEIQQLSNQEKDYKKLIDKGFRVLKARQCMIESEINNREGLDYETIIAYANDPEPHATNSRKNVWR